MRLLPRNPLAPVTRTRLGPKDEKGASFSADGMGTQACVSPSSVKYLRAFVGIPMDETEKVADKRLIQQLTLVGEHEGLVKRFSGFDKSRHTVPKFASDRAQQFLGRLAERELAEWSEELFAAYRESMGYRRKDISLVVEGGVARIESKDFVLERRYSLDEDSPQRFRVETELMNASSLDLLGHEPFNQATGSLFDRMRCHFKREVSVESMVDGIEDCVESHVTVDYPSTCEYCDARIEGLDPVFRFDSASLEIRFRSYGMPRQMIQAYRAMAGRLASIEVMKDVLSLG